MSGVAFYRCCGKPQIAYRAGPALSASFEATPGKSYNDVEVKESVDELCLEAQVAKDPNKSRRRDAGVTLLEMLVVVSILAAVTQVVFVDLRGMTRSVTLLGSRDLVTAAIRRCQARSFLLSDPLEYQISADGESFRCGTESATMPQGTHLSRVSSSGGFDVMEDSARDAIVISSGSLRTTISVAGDGGIQ